MCWSELHIWCKFRQNRFCDLDARDTDAFYKSLVEFWVPPYGYFHRKLKIKQFCSIITLSLYGNTIVVQSEIFTYISP